MRVEILSVPDCPNLTTALERVRRALDEVGLEADVDAIEVATQEEAERLGMRGSPTILLDGRDPFAAEDEETSVACRLYRSGSGVEGSPTVSDLVEALQR